ASHLTDEWQAWCLDRWGLTPETLRRFCAGFAPVEAKGLWAHLRAQGLTSQELAKTGLFVRVDGQFLDFFQGRLVIPYWKTTPDDTHPGEATYFIGRKTEHTPDVEWEQAKYRKLPVHNPDDDKKAFISPVVTNHHFFGEHILPDAHGKTLLVTEGIADALAALQAGIPCLSPGTVSFRETDWPRLSRLCRHAAKVVIVNDVETSNAGEKGALNTARHLVLQGIDARIGVLPKPDDIDKVDIADFLKDHDRAVLVGLIESAPTLFDHYLVRLHTVSEADQTAIAKDVYPLIAAVSGVEREKAERALAKALGVGLKALRASIAAATSKPSEASEERSPHGDEMPYVVNDGHIAVYEGINARLFPPKLVADFIATISHELTTEEGAKIFVVTGQTITGRAFTVQMPAREFADERALKAALTEASGASSPIYAGMAKHLAPAIQLMSPKDVCRQRQYNRTGWAGDSFLIPGRVGADVVVDLPRKLPYRIAPQASLTVGLKALQSVVTCMDQTQTTIGVTVPFQAPLAKLMGWQDERYALFIKGRTGSLKTSFAQMLMVLYGPDFLRDSLLIKFGQGATANAMMALATHAHDLPLLLDNYKPSTGGGARELINLVHNILEGGEKDRLSRASTLRETKPVSCWPIITGEDVPDTDPASLARMLILPFCWQAGEPNKTLADAQEQAEHLCAVGHAWLTWLESDDGRIRAQEEATKFLDTRADWAKTLHAQHKHMVNILRVATNLATHQLTWQVLCTHPSIGPVLHEFTGAH
ncbi:MAG TPA: hypothetical protein VE844_17845, partial [Gammaproteobacteria bacterium]|nr:hypothetical protein [Gammaproteobacteria bacterium]